MFEINDPDLIKRIKFLYPSEDHLKIYREFCNKRIKMTLLVLISGILLACFIKLGALMERKIPSGGFERPEWSERKQKVELAAKTGGSEYDMDVNLYARVLSEEELNDYLDGLFPKKMI